MIKINVGSLLSKAQGSRMEFDIDESVNFDYADELDLSGPVTGRVTLLKLPHEINVQVHNLHAALRCQCSRCLKPLVYPVNIEFIEREFIVDLPDRDIEPGESIQYINENNEIVLDDMIREEILLHFPAAAVCSESCRGLCDQCGADLNEKTCECTHKTEGKQNPFK